MSKLFRFEITIECELDEEAVWPDNDGPDSPKASDARDAFMKSCDGNILRGVQDWDLDQFVDLHVTEE